ncbi:MAG: hypothetical protein EBR30_14640 [Cytophagia bacterium]|nr:hypothetical protein [Cytophagia bacterium]NBW36228.1 hypothetical protein [Cytophagia bacterium]
MRSFNVALLCSLIISVQCFGQNKPIAGFIFKSLKVTESNVYDFFVLSEIDTSKSLVDNLAQLKSDTLIRIGLSEYSLDYYNVIENINVPIKVLPVEVIWSDWTLEDMFLHQSSFISYLITLGNHTIINGYNPKKLHSFKEIRVLKTLSNP